MASKRYVSAEALEYFLSKIHSAFVTRENFPELTGETDKFLNADGDWEVPAPQPASGGSIGAVKPDGITIVVSDDGTISVNISNDPNDAFLGDGTWGIPPKATVAEKLGEVSVGNTKNPIFLHDGVPTEIEKVGSASNADKATQLGNSPLSSEDLNDYFGSTYWGRDFYAAGGNTVQNKPEGVGAFGLTVTRSASGYTTQFIWAYDGGSIYYRSCADSTDGWTAWKRIYPPDVSDVAGKLGEDTVGSPTEPIYLREGTPIAIPKVGNASVSDKLGEISVGSSTQPIYLENGEPRVADDISRSAASDESDRLTSSQVTNQDLNTFYGDEYQGKQYFADGDNVCDNKPDGVGGFGLLVEKVSDTQTAQFLVKDDGSGVYYRTGDGAGTWGEWTQLYPSLYAEKAGVSEKLGTETVGSPDLPIYLDSGVPKTVDELLHLSEPEIDEWFANLPSGPPSGGGGFGGLEELTDPEIDEWFAIPFIMRLEDMNYQGAMDYSGLPSDPTEADVGKVYNISTPFTTTDKFLEGNGIYYPAGTDVVVVNIDGAIKYDVFGGNLTEYLSEDEVEEPTNEDIDGLFKK